MKHLGIRTQLVIVTVLIISGLTGALLLIIRHTIRIEVEQQIIDGTRNSVRAFENIQSQREVQLSRAAAMLAEVPTLKALMTTGDPLTIQDGSATYWKLAGSDLLALAKTDGRVVAMHLVNPGQVTSSMRQNFERSLNQTRDASWWYDDGRLYWVFERPIVAGAGPTSQVLGVLAVGYQVDASVAEQLSVVVGNQIALETGNTIIASTLPAGDAAKLQAVIKSFIPASDSKPQRIFLQTGEYAFSSVLLQGVTPSPVRCFVLMPLGSVNAFMGRLNRTIYSLGISAVILAAVIFGLVARTITRPLDNLVAGVRALSTGNFTYSIMPQGSSEVTELSTAFAQMREQLFVSQQQRIESERIAALGRAASYVSHDLRNYLATMVANAEFLSEADELKLKKSEIYEDIKIAANQMTDLIDSLRELSSQRTTIAPKQADLTQVIRRAAETIRARPESRKARVLVVADEQLDGVFDPKKLERAFFNLILNACEAEGDQQRKITVEARKANDSFEIRIADNGPGIAPDIRETLFNPFVSFGKPNGTGVGLAIVKKIVQDHGGSVGVEATSAAGTVVLVVIPCNSSLPDHLTPATASLPI